MSVMDHKQTIGVNSRVLNQKQQNIFGCISLFWSVKLQGHSEQLNGGETTIGWFRHRWAQFSEVYWCSLIQTLVHQDTHFVFNSLLNGQPINVVDLERQWWCGMSTQQYVIIFWYYTATVAWLGRNTFGSVNVVALRRARLVLGWVTISRRVNHISM